MKRRYPLTLSVNYVPKWTYIESFRELFQNAIDKQISNPDNIMTFEYSRELQEIKITNKTSVLEVDSLLFGSTTKRDDTKTIGEHGEGYKLAFMVLLREGKKIKVYNYGKREIWEVKLVKSKVYNNKLVPTVIMDTEGFWKKVPDADLTIVVGNVTEEEYTQIVKTNLHLRHTLNAFDVPKIGRILTDEQEKGNIYVKGLYVCNNDKFNYGYDFEPSLIELDRDRALARQIDVAWQTSVMWKYAFAKEFKREEVKQMLLENKADIEYFTNRSCGHIFDIIDSELEQELADELANDFVNEYGNEVVPVTDNNQLARAQEKSKKAVMVTPTVAAYIRRASSVTISELPNEPTIKEQLQGLLDDIESKLSDEEIKRFQNILKKM